MKIGKAIAIGAGIIGSIVIDAIATNRKISEVKREIVVKERSNFNLWEIHWEKYTTVKGIAFDIICHMDHDNTVYDEYFKIYGDIKQQLDDAEDTKEEIEILKEAARTYKMFIKKQVKQNQKITV